MKINFTAIILIGFRATGKSTIGKLLAQKLKWDFLETDQLIVQKTDKTINELTVGGTDWYMFRQFEHEILKDVLKKNKVVISSGGGMFVNKVLKKGDNKTFGKLNTALLTSQESVLKVLLTASEDIIKKRIATDEKQRLDVLRPVLDKNTAEEIKNMFKRNQPNLVKSRKVLIRIIVDDAIKKLRERQQAYLKLADLIIDTGKVPPQAVVEKILILSYNTNN